MTISPAIPSNGCNDFGPIDTRVGDQVNAEQAAASDAANASDRTHGVIWSAAAAIPCLGQPLESVQEMSDVVSSLASDVLVPSANLAQVLDPDKLRTGDAVDTAMLRDAQRRWPMWQRDPRRLRTGRSHRSQLVGCGCRCASRAE